MIKYITLLRGINVSGQKIIKMSDLKILLESLNFTNVLTYIQSGNIIFKSSLKNRSNIENKIKNAILSKYGFNVPTLVKTSDEFGKVINSNPFNEIPVDQYSKLHVTFLHDEPEKALVRKTNNYEFDNDEFKIIGKDVYIFCPQGYGKTKLSNNFFEKKLKVTATTRNWKTIKKLKEMAESI